MSYRFMRTVVMFDLPTETSMDRRHYRWFRKFLINEGFIMMQESIYSKICINRHAVRQVELSVQKNKPPKGIVQMLTVTEKQFNTMKMVVGEVDSADIQDDKRMIII